MAKQQEGIVYSAGGKPKSGAQPGSQGQYSNPVSQGGTQGFVPPANTNAAGNINKPQPLMSIPGQMNPITNTMNAPLPQVSPGNVMMSTPSQPVPSTQSGGFLDKIKQVLTENTDIGKNVPSPVAQTLFGKDSKLNTVDMANLGAAIMPPGMLGTAALGTDSLIEYPAAAIPKGVEALPAAAIPKGMETLPSFTRLRAFKNLQTALEVKGIEIYANIAPKVGKVTEYAAGRRWTYMGQIFTEKSIPVNTKTIKLTNDIIKNGTWSLKRKLIVAGLVASVSGIIGGAMGLETYSAGMIPNDEGDIASEYKYQAKLAYEAGDYKTVHQINEDSINASEVVKGFPYFMSYAKQAAKKVGILVDGVNYYDKLALKAEKETELNMSKPGELNPWENPDNPEYWTAKENKDAKIKAEDRLYEEEQSKKYQDFTNQQNLIKEEEQKKYAEETEKQRQFEKEQYLLYQQQEEAKLKHEKERDEYYANLAKQQAADAEKNKQGKLGFGLL